MWWVESRAWLWTWYWHLCLVPNLWHIKPHLLVVPSPICSGQQIHMICFGLGHTTNLTWLLDIEVMDQATPAITLWLTKLIIGTLILFSLVIVTTYMFLVLIMHRYIFHLILYFSFLSYSLLFIREFHMIILFFIIFSFILFCEERKNWNRPT